MSQLPKSAAIIAGAGMGHRLGAEIPKALIQIQGITLLSAHLYRYLKLLMKSLLLRQLDMKSNSKQ
jgi:Predicted sugar nucleotidyltransferases